MTGPWTPSSDPEAQREAAYVAQNDVENARAQITTLTAALRAAESERDEARAARDDRERDWRAQVGAAKSALDRAAAAERQLSAQAKVIEAARAMMDAPLIESYHQVHECRMDDLRDALAALESKDA